MFLLIIILGCGSKTVETETNTISSNVQEKKVESASDMSNKNEATLSTPASFDGSTAKTVNPPPGSSSASTSATVTFVKPAETHVETDEVPMDDYTTEEKSED